MSRRVEGGVADGIQVGDGGTVRWIDPAREMGFRRSAPGRHPYTLDERGVYVPAVACECGSILEADDQGIRPDPCPLCGHDRWNARNGGLDGKRNDDGAGEGRRAAVGS